MTLITTVLLGAGVLFIASALDNTPLVQTFQKILNGTPIDWGATGNDLLKSDGTKTGAPPPAAPPSSGAISSSINTAPPTTTPHKS